VTLFRTAISSLILSATLLFGLHSRAQTTATPTPTAAAMVLLGAPSGASFFDAGTIGAGTTAAVNPTIYAGYTGISAPCTAAGPDTNCNSCTGGPGLFACSQTSIHTGEYLTIRFKSSTTAMFTPTSKLKYRLGNSSTQVYTGDTGTSTNVTSTAINNELIMRIEWFNKLCVNAGGDSLNCANAGPISTTLTVGIDSNDDGTIDEKLDFNLVIRYVAGGATSEIGTACTGTIDDPTTTDGICDYSIKKGDKKVYLHDFKASNPSLITENASVKYNRMVLFYETFAKGTGTPSTITNASPYAILDLQNNDPADPSLADPRIKGLENNTEYCFALGNRRASSVIIQKRRTLPMAPSTINFVPRPSRWSDFWMTNIASSPPRLTAARWPRKL
jgi:hypothetical protein